MRKEALSFLDKPFAQARLESYSDMDEHIEEGVLVKADNEWIPIIEGVPSFLQGDLCPDLTTFAKKHGLPLVKAGSSREEHQEQARTNVTFSDKWRRFRSYGLESSHQQFLQEWYCKKLGLPATAALKQFYQAKHRILEVGPGSGFNTRFMAENCPGTVFAADVSDAAFTTYQNTRHLLNCHVVQADVMDLPFADGSFDFVIADGVLHHTPNTRKAVEALFRKVQPGGQFFFYVYKQMGAVRRFCDDYIRTNFTKLSTEDCYAACEALTDLGRELNKLQAKITLTKPIPVLGIPAGTHDVQRLLYYNFVKCFWNDAFDYETNNMVNFDWYHPHNAWQHTQTEVASWLEELGVQEFAFHDANPNGLSVLLRKPSSASRREAA